MGKQCIWQHIRDEAQIAGRDEPVLASFYHATILNHKNFQQAISFHLANKLNSQAVPAMQLNEVFESCLMAQPDISAAMLRDIQAYKERDPACDSYSMPFLYFKGYHALQAHRLGHALWLQGRQGLALFLQNQISKIFAVDIHPGATIGTGIMLDHATGVVIGETVVIGDDVSMLHAVTLGGSGCAAGDRHPKIGRGVLISAGAKILGNITVGDGAKIGAGSVVLETVAAHATVVGVPARVMGAAKVAAPVLDINY